MSDTGPDVPGKRPTCCQKAVVVFSAICGLVTLIMGIIAYNQLAAYTADFQSIVDSWNALPVVEMTMVDVSAGCPSPNNGGSDTTAGWTEITSTWPGLFDACNCANKDPGSNQTDSDTSACSNQAIDEGCVSRFAGNEGLARTLDVYPNRRLCVRRGGIGSIDRPRPDKDGNCPPQSHRCGSASRYVCWPDSLPDRCPVTDFVFTATPWVGPLAANLTEVAAQSLPATPIWLYYTTGGMLPSPLLSVADRSPGTLESDMLPIVDVAFQPNDPCALGGCGYSGVSFSGAENKYKQDNPSKGYTLRGGLCNGGCSTPGDSDVSPTGRDVRATRSIRLPPATESRTFVDVFQSATISGNPNPVPSPYDASDAGVSYGITSTMGWMVSYRSEILWQQLCPRDQENVEHNATDVSTVKSAQTALMILSIFSFLVLSIYIPCVTLARPEWGEEKKVQNTLCKAFFKIACAACTVVTIIIAYRTLGFWNDINDAKLSVGSGNTTLASTGCTDALSQETFTTLGGTFHELSNSNVITMASEGSSSIVEIANGIISKFV